MVAAKVTPEKRLVSFLGPSRASGILMTIVEGTVTAERTDGACAAHIPRTKTFPVPNILRILFFFFTRNSFYHLPLPTLNLTATTQFYEAAVFTFDKGATSVHITPHAGEELGKHWQEMGGIWRPCSIVSFIHISTHSSAPRIFF